MTRGKTITRNQMAGQTGVNLIEIRECAGQHQGVILGFLERLNERAHAGHSRIKFTLPVRFLGVPQPPHQALHRGAVAVGGAEMTWSGWAFPL